jgi:DNA-directed RNA polymerase specialized sigma24 family protein
MRCRFALSLDGDCDATVGEITDPSSPDPPQEAIARELAARIEDALKNLPFGQRAAMHLAGLGYTLPEIAEMIGTTHGNARVLVHRALCPFPKCLPLFELK